MSVTWFGLIKEIILLFLIKFFSESLLTTIYIYVQLYPGWVSSGMTSEECLFLHPLENFHLHISISSFEITLSNISAWQTEPHLSFYHYLLYSKFDLSCSACEITLTLFLIVPWTACRVITLNSELILDKCMVYCMILSKTIHFALYTILYSFTSIYVCYVTFFF